MHCERPEFYATSEPVARKRYNCCECDAPILPGEKHTYCRMKFDGIFDVYRQHDLCAKACEYIRDNMMDEPGECVPYGELKSWVADINPDWMHNDLKAMLNAIADREQSELACVPCEVNG